MASVARRFGKTVRRFLGRARKFITNTDKKKEVFPYYDDLKELHFWENLDEDQQAQPIRYCKLKNSTTELNTSLKIDEVVIVKRKNIEDKSKSNDTDHRADENILNGVFDETNGSTHTKEQNNYESNKLKSKEKEQDKEKETAYEASEIAKCPTDSCKIEVIRDNIDWSGLDEMKAEFQFLDISRHQLKNQIRDVKNCSPVWDTSKQQQNTAENISEKKCQELLPKSAHSKKSPNNEELDINDIVLEEDSPIESFELLTKVLFQIEKLTPDVLLEVDEYHQFLVHRQKLLIESGYFLERLRVPNKSFWNLKVDPQYVDPKALKCILHFLYDRRPFTCRHFAKVITTAIYLEMNRTICSLQLIIFNRKFCVDVNLHNCLLKYALAFEMRNQLDNSQINATDNLNNVRVIVKGQKGDLTEEDFDKLCDFGYIQIQSERSVNYITNRGGNAFEQVAVRPHVVVDITDDGLTLWVFNVFKSNFDEALFIDALTWMSSLETSLQLSAMFLCLHYRELLLTNAHLQLNEAQLKYILQQDIVGIERNEPTQYKIHPKRLLQLLDQHKNTHVLNLECKSKEEK